jgi:hypothetical protein
VRCGSQESASRSLTNFRVPPEVFEAFTTPVAAALYAGTPTLLPVPFLALSDRSGSQTRATGMPTASRPTIAAAVTLARTERPPGRSGTETETGPTRGVESWAASRTAAGEVLWAASAGAFAEGDEDAGAD